MQGSAATRVYRAQLQCRRHPVVIEQRSASPQHFIMTPTSFECQRVLNRKLANTKQRLCVFASQNDSDPRVTHGSYGYRPPRRHHVLELVRGNALGRRPDKEAPSRRSRGRTIHHSDRPRSRWWPPRHAVRMRPTAGGRLAGLPTSSISFRSAFPEAPRAVSSPLWLIAQRRSTHHYFLL